MIKKTVSKAWFSPEKAFLLGFLILLIGDLINTLVIGKSTLDIQIHDTIFVIANLHLLGFFALLFLAFAAVYWGLSRIPGRAMNAPLAYLHFAFTLIGAYALAWPMHYEGLAGMPRRYIDYSNWPAMYEFERINFFIASTSTLLIFGQLFFVINLFYTALKRKK
jgi:cytochrome c oxidase subunit I